MEQLWRRELSILESLELAALVQSFSIHPPGYNIAELAKEWIFIHFFVWGNLCFPESNGLLSKVPKPLNMD
jgi:hypothetical protein